ncbi:outer membrane protein [Sphingomonas nostoxanthinifaciens]|uniref:outer membrane protein n=1 Tax=Sphingomonas nostoxanthinifaciens TaxID=2872652 RepID=UPI001CC1EAA4|nr:outer membrane beta-barrel protein [Sphingomonas nostoxanthinifaciens]UAK25580.1 outer membrane beta-barrel protein [Sphingomonas nostoxanthinifaciens]
MLQLTSRTMIAVFLTLSAAGPAIAQSDAGSTDDHAGPTKGFYVVGRVGGTVANKGKLDIDSSVLKKDAKYKAGLTGEIGGGYDFGMFRLEQTIGYSDLKLDRNKSSGDGVSSAGRAKVFSVLLSGFVDIPVSRLVTPYIGGGAGIARVESNLSSIDTVSGNSSSFNGKKYGLLLHADAGVGLNVAPHTTLEVGGRYTRISGMKFKGENLGVDTTFKPKLSSLSGLVGVRYTF